MSLPISTLTGANTISQLIYNVNRIKTLAANTASTVANSTFQAALANTNSYIAMKANTSNPIFNGNVGIATAIDHNGRLSIKSTGTEQHLVLEQANVATDGWGIYGANGGNFEISRMTGTTTFTPRVTINSSGLRVHSGMIIYSTQIEQDNAAGLTFNSSHGSGGIYFSIAGSERMRLDSSGNMSIGTSTSDALLYARRTSGTTAPIGRFEAAIGAFTGTSLTAQNTLGTSNTYNLFTCVTDSDGDSGGPYTLFQVRGDGRVGILGSSINQSALRVNGSISVTSSDTDFGAGGNRAMIDLAGSVARMGAMNGGGGAVELALYSASAERMRINSSGNIGIGSSSIPSNVRAQIVGTNRPLATDDTANLLIGVSDAAADDLGGSIGFQHNGASGVMIAAIKAGRQSGTTGGGYLSFATRTDAAFSTERMRIDSSGNIHIGANASYPGKLTIVGINGEVVAGNSTDSLATFSDNGAASISVHSGSASTGTIYFGTTGAGGNTKGRLQYNHSSDAMIVYTDNTERMRIDSSGNLGIGTSSPSTKLHVAGSSNDNIGVSNSNFVLAGAGGNGLVSGTISSSPYSSYIQSGFLNGPFNIQYPLVLNPLGGKVGVATTLPTTTLDVTGTARATQGMPIASQSANTKTLALTDNGYYVRCSNSTTMTVTIPNNSTVAFPTGAEMVFFQVGAGNVQFANAAGVTVNSKDDALFLTGQFSAATLKKITTNTWDLIGDLA
jgi:hypothetical protein